MHEANVPAGHGDRPRDLFTSDEERRPFEVSLRWHSDGTWIRDDEVYTWSGLATDEAEAVTVARRHAAEDDWNADNGHQATSFRVVEQVEFLPVPSEGAFTEARTLRLI
jgi:hypothetical protein